MKKINLNKGIHVLPIRKQVTFGFTLAICFLILILSVAFFNFNKIKEKENDVLQVENINDAVNNIKHELLREEFIVMELLESDQFSQIEDWEHEQEITSKELITNIDEIIRMARDQSWGHSNINEKKRFITKLNHTKREVQKNIFPRLRKIINLSILKVNNPNKTSYKKHLSELDTKFDLKAIHIINEFKSVEIDVNKVLKRTKKALADISSKAKFYLFLLGGISIIISIFFAFVIIKRLRQILGADPLEVSHYVDQLTAGSTKVEWTTNHPEGLLATVVKLHKSIEEKIQFASEISQGNYEYKLNLNSEHDEFGHALIRMASALQQNTEKITDLLLFQKAILDSTEQAIVTTNELGLITQFNQGAEKMLGYTAEEVIGKSTPLIFHEQSEIVLKAHRLKEEFQEEFPIGKETFIIKALRNGVDEDEWTYTRKDGSTFKANKIIKPIYNSKNELVGFNSVSTDITKLSEYINEIKLLKQAIDETSIVTITDQKGVILDANKQFLQVTGYTREEIIGQPHSIVNSGYHSKEFFKEMWKTLGNGQIWKGEIRNVGKHGNIYWVNTAIFPVLDKKNKPIQYISIRQDITERKVYENDILRAKTSAEELARAKDNFMSSMSHEIRTPLNGILGFTNLLLADQELKQEQRKQLDAIKTSGDILLVIINDILDISKIEAGKMKIEQIPLDLEKICEQVIDTFSVKIEAKNLEFKSIFDPQINYSVISDPVRISQILLNIFSNAIKFTPEKGKITLEVNQIYRDTLDSVIELKITDTGIGIPEDRIDAVFQPFVQTADDTARKYGGTGLGLTIVKKIIDLMHGEIKVSSEFGVGTTFQIQLPFHIVEQLDEVVQTNENKNNLEPINTHLKVLLAEDNAINQLLAQTVLSQLNIAVVTVNNGKEAFEKVQEEEFDLILMDLMMPEMDGYEATSKIRSLDFSQKNIPIIALTADVTNEVTEKCKEVGMNDYLSKPFDGHILHQLITRVLAIK